MRTTVVLSFALLTLATRMARGDATDLPEAGFATAAVDASPEANSKRPRQISGLAGIGLGYGPTLHAYRPRGSDELEGPDTYTGFNFALVAGVMLQRAQLMVEWAPGTFQPLLNDEPAHVDAGDSFYTVIGSAGYYIPVTDMVSWPLRIGAGVASDRSDLVARLDLVNVAVKLDHFVIEAALPSIRYMSDFDRYHRWTGLFGVSGTYLFP